MEDTPPGRLPWERDGEGFIARPNGPDAPDKARLWRHEMTAVSSIEWIWEVTVGETKILGNAPTSQAAADAATEAWPKAVAGEIIRLGVVNRRQALFVRGDRFMSGEIELEAIGLADAVYDDALTLQLELRKRWEAHKVPDPQDPKRVVQAPADPRLTALMDALSAEFLGRRTG